MAQWYPGESWIPPSLFVHSISSSQIVAVWPSLLPSPTLRLSISGSSLFISLGPCALLPSPLWEFLQPSVLLLLHLRAANTQTCLPENGVAPQICPQLRRSSHEIPHWAVCSGSLSTAGLLISIICLSKSLKQLYPAEGVLWVDVHHHPQLSFLTLLSWFSVI